MKFTTHKVAAAAAVGALVLGSLLVATEAASAAPITAGNPVVTLYGAATSATQIGPVITGGSVNDPYMFRGITVSEGCPSGAQQRSDSLIYQNGTKIGSIAGARFTSTTLYGATGLDGNPINMSDLSTYPNANNFVANGALGNLANYGTMVSGAFDLRIYCSSSSSNPNFATDAYFDVPMTLNTTAGTWSLYTAPTATTVSLTAQANNDQTITLTGTVKTPSNATATAAVGSVEFFNSSSVEIGSGTVTNGVGTFTTPAETPGSYSFTAEFVESGDPTYGSSPMSGTASCTVSGPNVVPSTITVTIPAGTGSLTLTGVQSAINLGTATVNGSLLTASGALGPVTVTDTRQVGAANWSLTGQDTDFSSGSNTFSGGYLGWTPALVAGSNAGTAGAAVLPTPTGAGLKSAAATLASGGVVVGTPNTVVGATLNLAVPSQTPAGVYTSTLTITLA